MKKQMRAFKNREMADSFCKEHTIIDVWSTTIFGETHWVITYLEA